MPRTIEITVYKFNELSDKAKQVALDNNRDISVDYDWWESTYEDAANIGLRITEFDLDRNQHAKGDWNGCNPDECANNIMVAHGEATDTYKLAKGYLESLKSIGDFSHEPEDSEARQGWEIAKETRDNQFLKALLKAYAKMLQDEADYLTGDEHIADTLIANEYEFTSDGKRFYIKR